MPVLPPTSHPELVTVHGGRVAHAAALHDGRFTLLCPQPPVGVTSTYDATEVECRECRRIILRDHPEQARTDGGLFAAEDAAPETVTRIEYDELHARLNAAIHRAQIAEATVRAMRDVLKGAA